MLSIFPELFTYSLLAPTALRIVMGGIFLYFAYRMYSQKEVSERMVLHIGWRPASVVWTSFVVVSLVGGALLVVGLFTQVAALALAICMAGAFFISLKKEVFGNKPEFFLLATFVLLAIVFWGPGIFAIDWPL
jgi:uncharacterized membrane protein YphA (DoxX/SURF4 family)